MAFDATDSSKNYLPPGSEYGGVPGLIQPKSLGHNINAPDHVQEKRALIAFEMIHASRVDETLPETDEHYGAVTELQALRAQRLGEYRIEDAN
jgi:hypothetical protein